MKESLTNKVKPGDRVVFHVGDMSSAPGDWGFETEEEMAPVHAHDGQVATVDVIAIDDGDPASEIIDGPFYVDITFEDGFTLSAVDGYNLTPVENTKTGAQTLKRPVAHDFIPAVGPAESLANQAANLVKTVLERARGINEDLSEWINAWGLDRQHQSAVEIWGNEELWAKIKQLDDQGVVWKTTSSRQAVRRFELQGFTLLADEDNYDNYDAILYRSNVVKEDGPGDGGPTDEEVRAYELAHSAETTGGKDPDMAVVEQVMAEVSQWHAGQMQSLIGALAGLFADYDMLTNMKAQEIEQHLREVERLLGERTGD